MNSESNVKYKVPDNKKIKVIIDTDAACYGSEYRFI